VQPHGVRQALWGVAQQVVGTAPQPSALPIFRTLRPFVVMVNESIIYEREIRAYDEEDALRRACSDLQRGRVSGWREVGRVLRNLRTRRP